MATFRFELDHKTTRNKTYNLYMMVTVAGKRVKKKTGVQLKRIDDFNPQCKGNNWIRANVPDATSLNEYLRQLLVQANETYNKLDHSGETTSSKVIKAMNTEYISPSFLAFAKERAQMIYDAGGFRNWKKYCGFINKLDAFRKQRRMADITVDDLTIEFLTKFDNFLHKWENEREPGKLLHPNTIEVQFNVMRALVHRAIEVGIMDVSKDPFIIFKYKGVKTMKEKLNDEDINKIIELDCEEGSLIWHCKNYFLFSYYCAGIRAADLIQLRWKNITNTGRLRYQMGKNHKVRDLLLVDQALEILRFYHREDMKPEDYIFPMLSNDAPYAKFITQTDKDSMKPELRQKLYQDVSSKNALINKYLKKIAEKAGIQINLTMHMSRHAFAHIAQEAGAESGAIKNILGHSNLSTTERYMGNFDTTKTDDTLKSLFTRRNSDITKDDSEISEEKILEYLRGKTMQEILELLAKSQI